MHSERDGNVLYLDEITQVIVAYNYYEILKIPSYYLCKIRNFIYFASSIINIFI